MKSVRNCLSLHCLNFEMAEKFFEYGKHNLNIFEKKCGHNLEFKNDAIEMMLKALRVLGRYSDSMHFCKEKLKIDITLCNKQFHKSFTQVLESYVFLVESQIQNQCFSKAVKICNRVTLFKLNSLDPLDVLKTLKTDDYREYFTITNLSKKLLEYEAKQEERYNFEVGKINEVIDFIKRATALSTFCVLKCMIFKEFDDLKQCHSWTDLPLLIYYDILTEIMKLRKNDYASSSMVKKS